MLDRADRDNYKSFINGQDEAFEEIVMKYREPLCRFIRNNYVRDYATAEDISQDTFIYMYKNKKEYDFKYSLKTYLFTIAKCRAKNVLKEQKRYKSIERIEEQASCSTEYLEEEVLRKEREEQILNEIGKLKEIYRSIIYLADIENFSYKEICKIMDKTMPQVKSLLYRARQKLEKNIKKEGTRYDKPRIHQ